jgi:hypothetical protein
MLAVHLAPTGRMFAFLAAHCGDVFPDADYTDLFALPGRAAVAAGRRRCDPQMAAIMTLQTLCDYSDREAAGAARFDVRWKVACGLAIDEKGFPSLVAGVLAQAAGEVRSPAQDQRRGQEGGRGDRDLEGPAAPGGGLDDPSRCGAPR